MAVASRTSMTVRCATCGHLGTHLNGPYCLHCQALLPPPGTPKRRPAGDASVLQQEPSVRAAVAVLPEARPASTQAMPRSLAAPAPAAAPSGRAAIEQQLPRYGPPVAQPSSPRPYSQWPAPQRRMVVGPAPAAPRNVYADTALVYGLISAVITVGAGFLGYYIFGLLSLYALYFGIRGVATALELRTHAGLVVSLVGLLLSASALVLTVLVATGIVPVMVSL